MTSRPSPAQSRWLDRARRDGPVPVGRGGVPARTAAALQVRGLATLEWRLAPGTTILARLLARAGIGPRRLCLVAAEVPLWPSMKDYA